ncbi:MAG: DUF3772 domain-containing protein [Brevirhabdus sp.]
MKQLAAALVAMLVLCGVATAQEAAQPPVDSTVQAQESTASDLNAPDYAAWSAVAARANEAIDANRASTTALEELRAQLADWREQFQQAQTVNADRIASIQSQLQALGTAPENGEQEPAEIAKRRAELEAEKTALQAPILIAQEAFQQADALIRSIDRLIRERRANALLELGPSPLNPASWIPAISQLSGSLRLVWIEVSSTFGQPAQEVQFRESLPAILLKLALAAVLLISVRPWLVRLNSYVYRTERVSNGALSFGISLGHMFLPLIGLLALVSAIFDLDVIGLRGTQLVNGILAAGVAFVVARWLGGLIFPVFEPDHRSFVLNDEQRRRGRWSANTIGASYGVLLILREIADYDGFAAATRAVLNFPAFVIGAIALFAIGRLLVSRAKTHEANPDERPYRDRLTLLLGRAIMAVAVIGPVMSAVGYNAVAGALLFPAFQTAALLATLFVLQQFIVDLYAIYTGDREAAQNALIPVLLGGVLWLAAAPLLALIWGARTSDLAELWIVFKNGFQFGDSRISPADFVTFAVVFSAGYVITRLLQGTLRNSVLPRTKIDIGGRNAITSFVGYIGIFVAAVVGITAAGLDLSSLAIVAGALSVGIGFGLQNIVSNFVSGIILLIERPISEGDWIEVGGNMGYVRDISVRSTRIETFDRSDVIVPNADLVSGTVVNYTRGKLIGRVIVPVGVAYGTDTRKVETILREIAEAHPMVLMNPAPGVVFKAFGASSLDFEIRAILRDVNYSLSTKSEINHEIARRFAEEGIEIPFPQTDLWLRNPEALKDKEEGA